MRFIRLEELKPGMRIARPIFSKKGVLLYDRATVLNGKYQECCSTLTTASLTEVRLCVSRMIVLAQVFDHAGVQRLLYRLAGAKKRQRRHYGDGGGNTDQQLYFFSH